MAIINCANGGEVTTALQTGANAGDIIKLAAGAFTGNVTSTAVKNWSANHVVITNQNDATPALIRGIWDIREKNGIDFENLIWEQTGHDGYTGSAGHAGWPIQRALYLSGISNFKIHGCTWRGTGDTATIHRGWSECLTIHAGLNPGGPVSDGVISQNEFKHWGVDAIRMYFSVTNVVVEKNLFKEAFIDQARAVLNPPTGGNRHADSCQGAGNDTYGWWTNVTIRNNVFLRPTYGTYLQGPFAHNESNPSMAQVLAGTKSHRNTKFQGNFIELYHPHGLQVSGNKDFEASGNKIMYVQNTQYTYGTGITVHWNNSGTIFNNVYQHAPGDPQGGLILTNVTIAGSNVVTNNPDIFPTGWNANLLNEVGPNGDSVIAPTTPPAMTVGEWKIGQVVEDPNFGGRYTAIIYVPAGTLPGFRWSQGVVDVSAGNSTTEGLILLSPPLADGSAQYRMNSAVGSGHTIPLGATFSDLRVYRRAVSNGPLSPASDAKSFTTTISPGPGIESVILDASDWTLPEVIEVTGLTNRFTCIATVNPGGTNNINDTTLTNVQLLLNGAWHDCVAFGVDGSGRKRWEPLPTVQGGSDHTVQYSETISGIRCKISTSAGTSLPSANTYSFTGPVAPVGPIAPDDGLSLGNLPILVGRLELRTAANNRPSDVQGDITTSIAVDQLVVYPPPLPPDGVLYRLSYGSLIYESVDQFSIPVVGGLTQGMIWAVNAAGVSGEARPFNIE